MKFTKEEAFESLKGILTNNGKKTLRMSERSLKNQTEILFDLLDKYDKEMELDAFVSDVSSLLGSTNSNVEKDASDKIKEYVKQWEKDHPQVNPEPPKADEPKEDDAMAKMLKRLEELESREAARDKEAKMSQKKKDLLKAMKEKGIKDEQWSKDLVAEISLTEDFDVEAKADSYLKLYNKSQAASAGNGDTTPFGTSSGGGNNNDNPFKATSELMKREREQFNNLK